MGIQTLWRPFNPNVSGKTGQPLSSPRWSGEYWARFEAVLEKAFRRIGTSVLVQPENVREGDQLTEVDLAVYAHRTKRDLQVKTAYSYPFFAQARKRLFYMLMHVPGWFQLDSMGWGADHSRAGAGFEEALIPLRAAKKFTAEIEGTLLRGNVSKFPQPPQEEIPLPGYVLHCIQMPGDYTIKYHSKVSVEEALNGLCGWANERRIPLMVKPHPVGTPPAVQVLIDKWKASPAVSIYRGNIHSAICRAKVVMVINSGTGVEALIHGKPVVTFGRCDYERATFRGSMANLNEAYAWARDHNPELQKKFLLWYYQTHIFDASKPSCEDKVVGYVKRVLDE